jgi:hypothetical protein
MKIIDSPTVGISASSWKSILYPPKEPDPVPPGFENAAQIANKLGRSLVTIQQLIRRSFRAGELDMLILKASTGKGVVRNVRFYRPKNYEQTKHNQNQKHRLHR